MTQLPGLLDTEAIRKDFPLLDRTVHDGKKIVYLDSAATSQKPRQVLDALNEYYERHNANVHRGVYTIAEEGGKELADRLESEGYDRFLTETVEA